MRWLEAAAAVVIVVAGLVAAAVAVLDRYIKLRSLSEEEM